MTPEKEIELLRAQLLAAQAVIAKQREALEYYNGAPWADVGGVNWFQYNFSEVAKKALSLTPDSTLLDEVVKVVDELLGSMYRYAGDVDDSPTIEHRSMCHRAEKLLSRLRQSTRETEEKI